MTVQGARETVTAYRCLECGEISAETAGARLYECGECGTIFNEMGSGGRPNQCPDCKRFASKRADDCCSVCEEGEIEQIDCYLIDDELVPVDEAGDADALSDNARVRAAKQRFEEQYPKRKYFWRVRMIVPGPPVTFYAVPAYVLAGEQHYIPFRYHHAEDRWELVDGRPTAAEWEQIVEGGGVSGDAARVED
jgi:DNA-directed RNA polymerase subunit RPC12/RpoP